MWLYLLTMHFLDYLLTLKGRVSLPIFAHGYLQEVEKHIKDLVTWWEHRHNDDLLLVFFDDLKEDHAGCVHRIAKFMEINLDEDTIARVVHITSHAEMSQHHSKFGALQLPDLLPRRLEKHSSICRCNCWSRAQGWWEVR